ncbi:hypothetical protein IAQ61_004610, partial [Plenodomus lingam]
LQRVTGDCGGVITDNSGPSKQPTGMVQKFRVALGRTDIENTLLVPATWPAEPQTTLESLLDQCDRWIKFCEHWDPDDFVMHQWSKLRFIVLQLHQLGVIPDSNKFHFCHTDLVAHNNLIEIVDHSNVRITGVLDWDASFVYFVQSLSLTQRHTICGYMEMDTNGTRPTSNEWKKYATQPEYLIARRIFEIFKRGASSACDYQDMDDVIADWQEIHFDEALNKFSLSDPDTDNDSEYSGQSEDSSDSDDDVEDE